MPESSIEIYSEGTDVLFDVRVTPRTSRVRVVGVHAGALKVALTAAPVDGAANRALIALLAKRLRVPRTAVVIQSGDRSRHKRVRVAGVDAVAVTALVTGADGSGEAGP